MALLRPGYTLVPLPAREYSHDTPGRGPGPLSGYHADCGHHPCAQFTKESLKIDMRQLKIRSKYGSGTSEYELAPQFTLEISYDT